MKINWLSIYNRIKNSTKQFISNLTLKDIIYFIIIFILLSIIGTTVRTCQNNKNEYTINIKALKDSISTYKTKAGKTVATIQGYSTDDIKTLDEDLYNAVKETGVKTSNVNSAVTVSGDADFGIHDTAWIVKTDTIYLGFTKQFNFDNEWRILEGNVKYSNDSVYISFDKDKVNFDYTIVIDNNSNIYIKSNNPYVTYKELSGYTIPKSKSTHWSVGPSVGVGYDVYRNKISPTIGISLNYGIFRW